MLDKLIAETEKEMQAVKDAEQRKDLQELDTLTHHLRSSWQILRADQPLRELYAQLHGVSVSAILSCRPFSFLYFAMYKNEALWI